ncbi:MAG: hypothetical protein ACPGVG_18740 [Mycobacterium sp.]
MQRPATWKVLTVGAAMAGLGVLGVGTAIADDTTTPPDVISEAPVTANDGGDDSQEESRRLVRWLTR